MKYLSLYCGKTMPALGLGTWQATEDVLEKALNLALNIGYRHLDTALLYDNEKIIGKVLNEWLSSDKINRNDLFVTTKLPPIAMYKEKVFNYFQKSLTNLNLSYVDLYLLHSPLGIKNVPQNKEDVVMDPNVNHLEIWKEMEKIYEKGLSKSIGVSNFNKEQIINILKNCKIQPSCLQLELHLYQQQKELVEFCKRNNIVVVAYCPLGSPGLKTYYEENNKKIEIPNLFENEAVKEMALKYKKSPAQILLRHAIDKGIGAIPKSSNENRLQENLDIFDFSLEEKDVIVLNGLDMGEKGSLTEWEPWGWL
ncbi:aldo-keto reductase family 1 member A1-like [Onthophagus taurus]|uniref:aldo-keto reductase family 1 member A1-like n=1 Tax=Onthophagus taurus TaxID=166361 RepID=UPI000C1FFB45|nr:alcohol dehydrogenase [NADP(+)]-like [Onthophagus taurus]